MSHAKTWMQRGVSTEKERSEVKGVDVMEGTGPLLRMTRAEHPHSPWSGTPTPLHQHLLQVPSASHSPLHVSPFNFPIPQNAVPLRLWREGIKGCSPAVPLHSPPWPFSGPLCAPLPPLRCPSPTPSFPHSSPWPYSPHLTLQPPTPLLGR